MEETLAIHKNEIIFYDTSDRDAPRHYRLNPTNIKGFVFDNEEIKKFFGLKKMMVRTINILVEDEDIPYEVITLYEHTEPKFRLYFGGLRSFSEDNHIPLEIKRLDE